VPDSPPAGSHAPEDAEKTPPRLALTPPRPSRAPGAYLPLPLWQRFALAGLIAVAALVAMIVYVSRHNTDSPASTDPNAAVQANREAEILVAQDQAPRVVRAGQGVAPLAAITAAVRADMRRRIATGSLGGPLQRLRCRPTGPARGQRGAFSCTVLAGSVTYPFLGVVDAATGRVTYCKRDPPPTPSDNVAVKARCRA
jgi:hypothetical protein